MRRGSRSWVGVLAAMCLVFGARTVADGDTVERIPDEREKDHLVTNTAKGTFEVELTPQESAAGFGDATVSRMAIDKQFHGDLVGTSKGEMLATTTDVEGSAGYVAIERVTGALEGRSGSFSLQHSGTMTRGAPRLTIAIIPDSGTGELTGISGTMTIEISDGKHSYELEYALPPR